jgi:hypothetical protein
MGPVEFEAWPWPLFCYHGFLSSQLLGAGHRHFRPFNFHPKILKLTSYTYHADSAWAPAIAGHLHQKHFVTLLGSLGRGGSKPPQYHRLLRSKNTKGL